MPTSVRVLNPKVFLLPAVQGLFRRGFAGSPLVPGGFDASVEDFVRMVGDPKTAVFLDAGYKGFGIVILPHNTLVPFPQILHLYSEGKPPVAAGLMDNMAQFVKDNGYHKVWAVNGSRKSDEVWTRAFRKHGIAAPLATLMEIEVL